MMLVTLEQAKLRLRVDGDDQDSDIELMISGASKSVLRYIGSAADEFLTSDGDVEIDSNGNPVGVPEDVQNATLYLVGVMLRDPDGADTTNWLQGYLPTPVVSILYPLRKPTVV